MKMTYQQMIMTFIIVMIIFFTINMLYPQEGPIVTMGVMITIFVIFKLYQYTKKNNEGNSD